MKKVIIVIVVAVVCFLIGRYAFQGNSTPEYVLDSSTATSTVSTTSGKICGYVENGIYTYKGVPYAEAERFEPPHAPKAWDGVRSSRYYGPTCPQEFRSMWLMDGIAYTSQWDDGYPGEDCLRINIWTPGINDGKKRPVMFWIHGGGFSTGSGQEQPGYDGHNMAAKGDVVFVSINHRLNVLGHLDLSSFGQEYAQSGNLGMLDIVAALEWVRDNIENFGGDPGNVTIMGQSGGGGKVSALYCMESAKGLFHRAVVQSGAMTTAMPQEFSQLVGQRTAQLLGLNAKNIDGIKTVPYADLLAAGQTALNQVREELVASGKLVISSPWQFNWKPVIDGTVLKADPFTQGTELLNNDVPLMIGSTINEMKVLDNPQVASWDDALAEMTKRIGEERATQLVAEYQKAYPDGQPIDLFHLDTGTRAQTIEQADIKAKDGGAPVYVYIFSYAPDVLGGTFLSPHCSEIPYAFNNVRKSAFSTSGNAEAEKVGDAVSDAWLNFARNGNPNAETLPQWDAYTIDDGATMFFDAQCHVRTGNFDRHLMELANGK